MRAGKHVHDPRPADASFHDDETGMLGGDLADDRGLFA
jgi:hypothetical protein